MVYKIFHHFTILLLSVQVLPPVHLDDGYSEEMEYKAAALSEDMTVFPAEGSIVEEKDLVVVKLSEITELPAVDWW